MRAIGLNNTYEENELKLVGVREDCLVIVVQSIFWVKPFVAIGTNYDSQASLQHQGQANKTMDHWEINSILSKK